MVPVLSHDPERNANPETAPRKLPEPYQDRPLEAISDDIRRILSADGTLHGDEDDPDFIRRQIVSIKNAALREGFLYDGLLPAFAGGAEHDVTFDPETGTVLKFTKPERAAYVVNFDLGTPKMASALPLEYMGRLMLQNDIFSDTLRFVGIGGEPGERRIITRQNIVVGRPASWEEITSMMVEDLGFNKLRHNHGIGYDDSYAFVRDDAVVFDMRPANVFTTGEGVVIPVDCIPVKLPGGKRDFFDRS